MVRHEDVWGSGGINPFFLTSALNGGEWSASLSARFNAGKTAPHIHWIGGWVGLKAGLDALEISLAPAGNRTPAIIPTEISRLPKYSLKKECKLKVKLSL
jgi:hypothetical protein